MRVLAAILSVLLLSGCGFLFLNSSPEEDAAVSFAAGIRAFEQEQLNQAVTHFRKIPPDSQLYLQSIQMIQKVPYQRGIRAYENRQYRRAVSEFRKIGRGAADYEKASSLRLYSKLMIQQEELEGLEGESRIRVLAEMSRIASQIGESEALRIGLDSVRTELKQSRNPRNSSGLLEMLDSMVSVSNDPRLREQALNQLLTDFELLHRQEDLRPQLFQLIGNIKLGLM